MPEKYNMTADDQKAIAARQKEYREGDRLICWKMHDPQLVPDYTAGTVHFVDDTGKIHMTWDNGQNLAIIPGEDEFGRLIRYRCITPIKVSLRRNTKYEELTQPDAIGYLADITKTMDLEFSRDMYMWPRGLADDLREWDHEWRWVDDMPRLDPIVDSVKVSPFVYEGKLVALITCEVTQGFWTSRERDALKKFISRELVCIWGKIMSEKTIKVSDGYLNIEFPHADEKAGITDIQSMFIQENGGK